jgi:hypothetical protein
MWRGGVVVPFARVCVVVVGFGTFAPRKRTRSLAVPLSSNVRKAVRPKLAIAVNILTKRTFANLRRLI